MHTNTPELPVETLREQAMAGPQEPRQFGDVVDGRALVEVSIIDLFVQSGLDAVALRPRMPAKMPMTPDPVG